MTVTKNYLTYFLVLTKVNTSSAYSLNKWLSTSSFPSHDCIEGVDRFAEKATSDHTILYIAFSW